MATNIKVAHNILLIGLIRRVTEISTECLINPDDYVNSEDLGIFIAADLQDVQNVFRREPHRNSYTLPPFIELIPSLPEYVVEQTEPK